MLTIKHTRPKRALSHLSKLQREGEALQARERRLTLVDEGHWDIRVWKYLEKIAADPKAFDPALQRDLEDLGESRFDGPKASHEIDRLLRQRISRRLALLAGVIEKVEAHVESLRANCDAGGVA